MFATYKNKDELKLKFKLLNLSFVSLFLYFMILQSYGNIVNFGGIQNSVSIVDTEFIKFTNLSYFCFCGTKFNPFANSFTEFTNKNGILTATITDKSKITEAQILSIHCHKFKIQGQCCCKISKLRSMINLG